METSVRDRESTGLTFGVFDRLLGGIRNRRSLVASPDVHQCKGMIDQNS
jgi:hypothetical protein